LTSLAHLNPMRFKGYYWDQSCQMYYLQSRFYDSEICRFISADDISFINFNSIGGLNLFAYCLNNPVMYLDSTGNIAISIFALTLLVGGLIGGGIGGINALSNDDCFWHGFYNGFIWGAITAAALPYIKIKSLVLVAGFMIGAGSNITEQLFVQGKSFRDVNILESLRAGAVASVLSLAAFGLDQAIFNPLIREGFQVASIFSGGLFAFFLDSFGFITETILDEFWETNSITFNDLRRWRRSQPGVNDQHPANVF
ncbi:MAG: RHS repeat-associated core domain-containing protein, partial [Erysipelotrichales bacterium]|nr:RHS repeat-associated core domain-containing protein [Erysipelotrichales bacterium]